MIATLGRTLPPDAIVTTDAGHFGGWAARGLWMRRPGTYLGPTAGAMGYGLPAAIAASLASPGRPVVALVGDGGLGMTVAELETAVREGARPVVLVFDNARYGTIQRPPGPARAWRPSRPTSARWTGRRSPRRSGRPGSAVETDEAFEPALRAALGVAATDGPAPRRRPALGERRPGRRHGRTSRSRRRRRSAELAARAPMPSRSRRRARRRGAGPSRARGGRRGRASPRRRRRRARAATPRAPSRSPSRASPRRRGSKPEPERRSPMPSSSRGPEPDAGARPSPRPGRTSRGADDAAAGGRRLRPRRDPPPAAEIGAGLEPARPARPIRPASGSTSSARAAPRPPPPPSTPTTPGATSPGATPAARRSTRRRSRDAGIPLAWEHAAAHVAPTATSRSSTARRHEGAHRGRARPPRARSPRAPPGSRRPASSS